MLRGRQRLVNGRGYEKRLLDWKTTASMIVKINILKYMGADSYVIV